jgi:nicotinamide mononucleotide transporter
VNPLEAAGSALGLLNLWLLRRQSMLCWPVGSACVLCFAVVFFEARLYSDAMLQGIYVALQAWGWWLWARGGVVGQTSQWRIARLSWRGWVSALAATAAGAAALGTTMAHFTRADLPYLDATATAISLAAQVLQARKVLESWLVFIAGNLLFIGIYLAKSLHLTAMLFVVSTVLAVSGYLVWRKMAVH